MPVPGDAEGYGGERFAPSWSYSTPRTSTPGYRLPIHPFLIAFALHRMGRKIPPGHSAPQSG